MEQLRPVLATLRYFFQSISLISLVLITAALVVTSTLAAAGARAWPELWLSLNGAPVENAGMYAQLALTLLAVSLCFLVPTNRRVMRLEAEHHRFSIRMEDVTRAYALAHAADRKGAFEAPSEFDAVKERIIHLQNHPDLDGLEADVLEVAAQMSRVSEDLAQAFSDEKVDRARDFLVQRQQEVQKFQGRIDHAKALQCDMRQWLTRVETDEAIAKSQLDRLVAEFDAILPEARVTSREATTGKGGVIRLPTVAAE